MSPSECRVSRVAIADIPRCVARSCRETVREVRGGRTDLCVILSEHDRGVYVVGLLLIALLVGVVLRQRGRREELDY